MNSHCANCTEKLDRSRILSREILCARCEVDWFDTYEDKIRELAAMVNKEGESERYIEIQFD